MDDFKHNRRPLRFPINVYLAHPWHLVVAVLLSLGVIGLAIVRRVRLGTLSPVCLATALAFLTLAAGDLRWNRREAGQIGVMADVSPSARGAAYCDPAFRQARLRELLGNAPYTLYSFSEDVMRQDIAAQLRERPAESTHFVPPDNLQAIVLLGDGQFDLPLSIPPTFCVVDPKLETPPDAAVTSLSIRGKQIAVATRVQKMPRVSLTLQGVAAPSSRMIPGHSSVQLFDLPNSAQIVSATIPANDAWPENNRLALDARPVSANERWWIGTADAPADFTPIRPNGTPADPARYLAPAIIVLDDVPAESLSQIQQDRLMQYVRDLGGTLVLLGGEHAFGAGGYDGSTLDALSPLASSPPAPTIHWLLLADGSGSMSAGAGSGTRWQRAVDSLARLLKALPADDLVSIGRFSDRIDWWRRGASVRQTRAMNFPPPGIEPRGPTNLQAVLQDLPGQAWDDLPKHLLFLTDGEANLDQADAIAPALQQRKIHLHVLAIGDGKALPELQRIAADTGGSMLRQLNPQQWAQSAQRLLQRALPERWIKQNRLVRLDDLGIRRPTPAYNRTWLKKEATALSPTDPPVAAQWRIGLGQVVALAFAAQAGELGQLIDRYAHSPGDPRLTIDWQLDSPLKVRIDASDRTEYLNGLDLSLRLSGTQLNIPQTAPGRYELSFPAGHSPQLAVLMWKDRLLQRQSLPGRYATEFDRIGTDRPALRDLAARSGGAVIEPDDHRPIDFPWPVKEAALMPWLALAGFVLLAIGFWKAQ